MIANLNLESINLWAVLVAAVAAFVFGAIWYSKPIFGKIWMKAAGITNATCSTGHTIMVFGFAFLLSLIAAFAFAFTLGAKPPVVFSVMIGALIGLCWVTTSFGINYLFASRSVKLFLIDAGYHTLQFMIYGAILGLWHQ